MNLPITIEPMTEKDLLAVSAIEEASFDPPWPLNSFRTDLQYNRLAFYRVAHFEDRIVGYIGAWLVLDEVHITTLAVDQEFRQKGIASALIQILIDEAAARIGQLFRGDGVLQGRYRHQEGPDHDGQKQDGQGYQKDAHCF